MSMLYVPGDLEAAYVEWQCNCGPAAVAALLGIECTAVRSLFPDFAARRYANPTQVQEALRLAGRRYSAVREWPTTGLVFVQWGGPWLKPGVPVGAAYARTHWISVDGGAVFDVNVGHWVSEFDWKDPADGVAAWLLQHGAKGNDGTWSVRTAFEVAR